jgi:hypothetical protein
MLYHAFSSPWTRPAGRPSNRTPLEAVQRSVAGFARWPASTATPWKKSSWTTSRPSHADPRTTMRYDRARVSLDRHATFLVAAFIASAAR